MKNQTVAVVGVSKARFAHLQVLLAEGDIDAVAVSVPEPDRELPEALRHADGILFGGSWPVTRDVIAQLDNCRVIGRFGLGYDSIDVEAATARNMAVVVARGYCEEDMADHVMAFLLAWQRHIVFYDRESRTGEGRPEGLPMPRISNLTVGLCGFGGVARYLARKLKAFGCEVIAHDPYVAADTFTQAGVEAVRFDELLRRSDVLSIHCALTKETRHLFSTAAFERMKTNALLINTARGAIVDTGALVWALENGQIAGACLDVVEEGALAEYNLKDMDRVLLTPHIAYRSEESLEDLYRIAATNVRLVLEGKRPDGLVNPAVASKLNLA